jgi:hypothetical protein
MKSKKSKTPCSDCPLNDDFYTYKRIPKWLEESNRQAKEYWDKNQHLIQELLEREKKDQNKKD